ncbi:hypothetical protein V496_02377 [Pseudogymnoascus sp. VKM F-4515 (FW-2607)]|nr:hypothetical protein V496_02377 [Pseudogymnoascus sp. VKM F-4515 (FW-2607)]
MDRRKDGAENKGKAARLAYWEVVIFLCCSNEEPARSVITGMPGRSTAVRRRHMPEADGFEGESMTMSVHEPPLSLTGAFLTFVLPAFMIWARPWAALARGRARRANSSRYSSVVEARYGDLNGGYGYGYPTRRLEPTRVCARHGEEFSRGGVHCLPYPIHANYPHCLIFRFLPPLNKLAGEVTTLTISLPHGERIAAAMAADLYSISTERVHYNQSNAANYRDGAWTNLVPMGRAFPPVIPGSFFLVP